MQHGERRLDIDGYMTVDETSALLNRPRSGLFQALSELGILFLVLLGFATAIYAAAVQLGFAF